MATTSKAVDLEQLERSLAVVIQKTVLKEDYNTDQAHVQSSITVLNQALEILNGDGNGSVNQKIKDKIEELINGASEDYDTFKEISDWIAEYKDEAAAMDTAIKKNQSSITTIQEALNEIEFATDAEIQALIANISSKFNT